jgi:sulfite reductase beta subunit-like hemoprotein
MNELFCENVPREELASVLRPVLAHYAEARHDGERFGAFCHRVGVARLRAELGTERWVRRAADGSARS